MTDALTLGIEEEFQLLDPSTRDLAVMGYDRLMPYTAEEIQTHLHPEFYQCVVETTTGICSSVEAAERETMAIRATVLEMARRGSMALVSAGTPPIGRWSQQQRTSDPGGRYGMIEDVLQDVARTLIIFGLHIHVQIMDMHKRIAVMNQVRAYLPYILALSANSAFWEGRPTGYQSYRTIVWAPFPLANVPDAFEGLESYAEFEDLMKRVGSLAIPRRIWWDVRPHHTLPTLEFRVADMPINHRDLVALIAYIQALVKTCLNRIDRGQPLPNMPTAIINENKWRAARFGLRGSLIDVIRGQAMPTRDLISESVELVRESADELGTGRYLDHIQHMLGSSYQTGAERQYQAYERRHNLKDVVDLLIQETAKDIDPKTAMPVGSPSFLARMRRRWRSTPTMSSPAAPAAIEEPTPLVGSTAGVSRGRHTGESV